jgi:hypothetical protein
VNKPESKPFCIFRGVQPEASLPPLAPTLSFMSMFGPNVAASCLLLPFVSAGLAFSRVPRCVFVCVCVCVIAHSQSGQEDWLGKLRRAAARERCVHKPRRCHQTRVCTLTRPSVVSRVSRPFSPTSLLISPRATHFIPLSVARSYRSYRLLSTLSHLLPSIVADSAALHQVPVLPADGGASWSAKDSALWTVRKV